MFPQEAEQDVTTITLSTLNGKQKVLPSITPTGNSSKVQPALYMPCSRGTYE